MGHYSVTVCWELGDGDFRANRYSRGHRWEFDGGIAVTASSSPQIVPLPHSLEEAVDPEEAFVASLSSCHMLFFLSLAAADGIVVSRYRDEASGILGKLPDGRLAITEVTLRPTADYLGDAPPVAELERLHHLAHEKCFIANSVRTEIQVDLVS